MFNRYWAAMFQPVSSVETMTNAKVAGEANAPWPTDPHEVALAMTKDAGERMEAAFEVLSIMDVTGAGQLGKAMLEGSPGGIAMAAMGVILPGTKPGGNIALSEAKQLVRAWSKGTFDILGESLVHHFGKHGAEVGATSFWQYLRKAKGFSKNLKGARKIRVDNGWRYEKNGRYIILEEYTERILPFGKVTE